MAKVDWVIPYGCDNWLSVKSSNISAIGTKENYLVIMFKGGGTYRYKESSHYFAKIAEAKSRGSYFHSIKNKLSHTQLCSNGCWEPVDLKKKEKHKKALCKSCWEKINGTDKTPPK